jgi:hypothetical protein
MDVGDVGADGLAPGDPAELDSGSGGGGGCVAHPPAASAIAAETKKTRTGMRMTKTHFPADLICTTAARAGGSSSSPPVKKVRSWLAIRLHAVP